MRCEINKNYTRYIKTYKYFLLFRYKNMSYMRFLKGLYSMKYTLIIKMNQ